MSSEKSDRSSTSSSQRKGEWKEVVRLTFKGEPYTDHALDLNALARLARFQRLVSETAKELWKAANPERERLPAHFEQRTRLCLRRVEEGSTVAPLEVYIASEPQTTLLDHQAAEVSDALKLVTDVFECVEEDQPLPEHLPRALVSNFIEFGRGLDENGQDGVSISTPDKRLIKVTGIGILRLRQHLEKPHEAPIELVGEMLAADVKNSVFKIWIDDTTNISVEFSPKQEEAVTSVLKDHRTQRVRVRGRGQFDSNGKLVKASTIDIWEVVGPEQFTLKPSAKSIEEIIADFAGQVPKEDWDRLPSDLSGNLDHYLYGSPKR